MPDIWPAFLLKSRTLKTCILTIAFQSTFRRSTWSDRMTVPFVIALAVFLGLLLFLYHQVRKAAWPIAIGTTPHRPKSRWRVVLAAIPVIIAAIVIWAFFIEPNRLVVRHQTIQISQWPRELSGIRIAVMSDIHVGSRFID